MIPYSYTHGILILPVVELCPCFIADPWIYNCTARTITRCGSGYNKSAYCCLCWSLTFFATTYAMPETYTLQTNFPVTLQPPFAVRVIYNFQDSSPTLAQFTPAPRQFIASHEPSPTGSRSRPIPKPAGQAGNLSRGGYSLRKTLDWDSKEYVALQVS